MKPQIPREVLDDLNWTIAFLFQYGEIGKAEQIRKVIAMFDQAPSGSVLLRSGELVTPQPVTPRTHHG